MTEYKKTLERALAASVYNERKVYVYATRRCVPYKGWRWAFTHDEAWMAFRRVSKG